MRKLLFAVIMLMSVLASESFCANRVKLTPLTYDILSAEKAGMRLWSGIMGDSYTLQLNAGGRKSLSWSAKNLPNGLKCSRSGKITGKPKESGTFAVDVKATGKSYNAERTLSLRIYASSKPRITTRTLPQAVAEASYRFKLTTNDCPAIMFRCSGIPEGLSMDTDGNISGVPKAQGEQKFDVTATNGNGTTTAKFTLNVLGSNVRIATARIPQGTYGRGYNAHFRLAGIEADEWTLTGELPRGLSFDAGRITGIPEESGTFTFTVRAGNGAVFMEKDFSLNVKGLPPKIAVSSLRAGITGSDYTFTLKAAGNSQATWSADRLPAGLSLDPNTGIISGVPAHDFRGKITITATNDGGSMSRDVNLVVRSKKPVIRMRAIPPGKQGEPYRAELEAEGSPPITWSFVDEIPAGLSVTSSGLIVGVPEIYGRYPVNVVAENSGGKTVKRFMLSLSEGSGDFTAQKTSSPAKNEPSHEASTHEDEYDYVTAAVISPLMVSADGKYSFPVEISKNVPAGSEMEFYPFAYGIESGSADCSFTDDEGRVITAVPESHKVAVTAEFESGVRYEPVITARVKHSGEKSGCESGMGITAVILLIHAIIIRKGR